MERPCDSSKLSLVSNVGALQSAARLALESTPCVQIYAHTLPDQRSQNCAHARMVRDDCRRHDIYCECMMPRNAAGQLEHAPK